MRVVWSFPRVLYLSGRSEIRGRKREDTVSLNAAVTNIRTRNPFLLWLLRLSVKLAGAEMRTWRSRPRREKKEVEEAPDA